ncbi:peroxiredoxin [Candidatus Kinetoplastidibacterium crithidiae]|uniref:thioredoxin-dependent peroxiredoxin n=1 Tax=Candidatus Kinetoplastidibacterium crithidiae TCC036E TaxID=1208918 RepID=M1LU77_9PROT|nr:peroxiredoxin [Candidatus Kinetoplastibacterium crithidii]AFZ82688.1 peroxiredoxin Q/BCP [Candidatus Kinetoplastibacterium crithidii (ex Angomonas deanei ATCC 30255)]AGF47656.1 peroxiredoxin Q/BCP [Candidatus Kinetoplastibacterium crithidii TCC036E]
MDNFIIKPAPKFQEDSTLGVIKLDDYLHRKNLILFFYPKDNTPGCTKENLEFKDLYREFSIRNTEVLGVSRDSIKSHENFKSKFSLPFPLISDQNQNICSLYNVLKKKNIYGKTVLGLERSTFLINTEGNIIMEWRKIKVDNHATQVLDFLDKTLTNK